MKSTEQSNNYYEVVLYKIFPNRVECAGSKYYKTTSPYKGRDCIIKQFKDYLVMKCIIPI